MDQAPGSTISVLSDAAPLATADSAPTSATSTAPPRTPSPPVPRTFREYLRSFGPGIVIVLTWLGAGDVVDMGVSGSNFGYALMWILVLALIMRFLFVSLIARYQLCNPHGDGVLDGLARLHPLYAPFILVAVIIMSHVYQSYMAVGEAEICQNLTHVGQKWQWALGLNAIAFVLVFQPFYRLIEYVFLFFLAVLSISFIGCAVWVGFDPAALAKGLYRLEMPGEHHGSKFTPLLVGVAMVGAVGGSIMNLAYPYFLEAKGWRGPQYRRVQTYDLLLGIVMMIVLNLAVWVLGAELLHPKRIPVNTLDDLPRLLSNVLGEKGRWLFYIGIFAAVYTSVIGHAVGLAYLGTHAWLRWRSGGLAPITTDMRRHPLYLGIVIWSLLTPLIWTMPGAPDFVTLTLTSNSAQVVLLPVLAFGLWWITADARFIGREHRNRWWENVLMAVLFALALWAAAGSIRSVTQFVFSTSPG